MFFYGGQWISVPPAIIDKIEQNVKVGIDSTVSVLQQYHGLDSFNTSTSAGW